MAETIKIGGELESMATGNIVTKAHRIYDEAKGEYQSQINAETDATLAEHGVGIRALNSQNYVTVDTYSNLPSTGSQDTAYRVCNWDGAYNSGAGQVDSTKYSEYAWTGSAYILLSVKSAMEETFDVSQYNASGGSYATYESFSDLLTNHLADIPVARRKGGMSIKFVQSSDHKYVQFRYMIDDAATDSKFTNTDNWSFCGDDVYVENPEFVRVITDKEGRILIAIEKNGNVLFGAGVPKQVVDYIQEKIDALSLDEYEDIVAFLGTLIEGDKTLQQLLGEKVDKVEGKSLIDEDYAVSQKAVENPEFLDIVLDNEDKILEGRKANGRKVINGGADIKGGVNIDGISITEKGNPEFTVILLDYEDKIVAAIKKNGDILFGFGVPSQIKNFIVYELAKKQDKEEGKGLSSNDYTDDEKEALNTCELINNPQYIRIETDAEGKILEATTTDLKKIINKNVEIKGSLTVGAKIYHIEDPEGRLKIETDSEGKVISYRDKDGVLHENATNTKFATIDVLNVRQIDNIGIPNCTRDTSIYLEKPKFAEFRFYGTLPTDQSLTRTPTTLNFLYKANGQILLSAKCTLAIQGHGSASYPKKGYTFEPINIDGDAIDIKWGDMIAVDSFHMKAYYSDRTHSRGIGGAKVWRQMIEQLPYPYNKVNNKALNIAKGQKIDAYCIADAKYSEDGFPFAFYLNDEFYGLYTLKLKKNRKNYGMEKSNKNEIFLDCLGYDVSVGHSGKLDDPFDAGAWDLKNPKLSGYEEGGEITDAGVLANIERLFTFTNNITTMYNQHEDYIVLPHWLCWYIHCELIGDVDKNGNNLELATWDGTHWSILPYDMDVTAGVYGSGSIQVTKSGYVLNPTFYQNFRTVFETEIKTLYSSLRKSGCIEINNLYRTYLGQIEAIPRDIYNEEVKKWPNGIWNDNEWPVIEQIYSYLNSRIEYLDSVWFIQ